jgi:hypothetical protein
MQWTKEDVIRQAFSEIGKGSDFDIQADDLQIGLRKLDAMMAEWGGALGIRVGFSGGNGKGDLAVDTAVPDWAYRALYLNLALNLCPDYGKTPSPITILNAKSSLASVRVRTVQPIPRRITGYAGSGNYGGSLPAIETDLAVGSDNTFNLGSGQ